jgi:hypothetical protein
MGRGVGFARAGMYIIDQRVDTYASLDVHLDRSQTECTRPRRHDDRTKKRIPVFAKISDNKVP